MLYYKKSSEHALCISNKLQKTEVSSASVFSIPLHNSKHSCLSGQLTRCLLDVTEICLLHDLADFPLSLWLGQHFTDWCHWWRRGQVRVCAHLHWTKINNKYICARFWILSWDAAQKTPFVIGASSLKPMHFSLLFFSAYHVLDCLSWWRRKRGTSKTQSSQHNYNRLPLHVRM